MLARNHPAVWLFIRYDGLPGLFFAVTVLCAGWFYLRGNRTDAVGYLAVLAAFWLSCNSSGRTRVCGIEWSGQSALNVSSGGP